MLTLLRIPWQSLWSVQTLVIFGRFFNLLRKFRLLVLRFLLRELWRLLRLLIFQFQLRKWLWPRPGDGTASRPPFFWHWWRTRRIREVEIESICWAKLLRAGPALSWPWSRWRGREGRRCTSSTSPPTTTPSPWSGAGLFEELKTLSFYKAPWKECIHILIYQVSSDCSNTNILSLGNRKENFIECTTQPCFELTYIMTRFTHASDPLADGAHGSLQQTGKLPTTAASSERGARQQSSSPLPSNKAICQGDLTLSSSVWTIDSTVGFRS